MYENVSQHTSLRFILKLMTSDNGEKEKKRTIQVEITHNVSLHIKICIYKATLLKIMIISIR